MKRALHRRKRRAGLTLIELLIVVAIMAMALLATTRAISITRALTARSQALTHLMLRAHSEIEARNAVPFDQLAVGTTELGGFHDARTTGAVTVSRLPDSEGLRIAVELVGRSHRGAEVVHLATRRFPEGRR